MGILGAQPLRSRFDVEDKHLKMFLETASELAKKHSISIDAVIEAKKALELERQNNIKIQSGDFTDEQVGGFGKILERIANSLENMEETNVKG